MVTFGNILDVTIMFSCIGIMLQVNNAIHLGRDPSLLLCGATLCGQVMAALVSPISPLAACCSGAMSQAIELLLTAMGLRISHWKV